VIRFLHPRWVALHLVVAVLAAGTVYAGLWQWDVATHHHDIRNYAYAIQWFVFLAFGLWFWVKIMRDASRRAASGAGEDGERSRDFVTRESPVDGGTVGAPYRGYAMPQASAIVVDDDPELARYNAYLTGLAAESQARSSASAQTQAPDAGTVPVRSEGRT
jgi:hypothetical protein